MNQDPSTPTSTALLPRLLDEAVRHFGNPDRPADLREMSGPDLAAYLGLAVRSAVVNRLFQAYASHLVKQFSLDPRFPNIVADFLASETNLVDVLYIKSFYPAVFHCLEPLASLFSRHLKRHGLPAARLPSDLSPTIRRFEAHQTFLRNVMLSSRQQIFETNLTAPSDKLDALLALEGYAFVCGPEFSGKSHFVSSYIGSGAGRTPHAVITIDKTTDLQSLLGNYVIHTSDSDARFEWKEGAFVRALRRGHLCVLENFELATDQLKSFLSVTLQSKSIKIRNKTVHFHQNFRVIVVGREADPQHIERSLHLPKLSLEAYLNIVLDKERLQGPVRALIQSLAATLHSLGDNANLHRQGRFARRVARLLGSLNLTDPSRLFLSSQTQTAILLHVLEVFMENSIPDFLNSEIFESVCGQIGLKGAAAVPMISAYETPVRLEANTLRTLRFHTAIPNPVGFSKDFVLTEKSRRLVESILGGIVHRENVLLIGETGCGKTTVVQELARLFNKKLNVFNLSHTTDAFDMFGGYRPVNQEISFRHQIDQFEAALHDHFSVEKNAQFLAGLRTLLEKKDYHLLAKGLVQAAERVVSGLDGKVQKLRAVQPPSAQTAEDISHLLETKERFEAIVSKNSLLTSQAASGSVPTKGINLEFIKGVILQSIERNEWLLLDEINLAGEEVLFRLYQVLFSDKIFLSDSAELSSVRKHPEFRLFACMNPAFEVGKKPLPKRIKEGFTTLHVSPIDNVGEVHAILKDFFASHQMVAAAQLFRLAEFYCRIRTMAIEGALLDKQDKKVVFTMRQLRRAAQITKEALSNQSVTMSPVHAIYVGVRLSFLLDLNPQSKTAFNALFSELFETKEIEKAYLDKSFYRTARNFEASQEYIMWQDFPLRKSVSQSAVAPRQGKQVMVITPNIRTIICDLMRVLLYDRTRPLLLEGPTSVGKTSIVTHLASLIGQKVVRLNNHRDTDLDEYIGSYVPDQTGQIKFQEGVLLKCMREGAWLLLDELNLARSEILEALNRVLDDNQELFVPELDAMIRPAPGFRIFATQNPNSYSGRSLLSTAFRNRFIVVNFDSHDRNDLKAILMAKEAVPESRAKLMLQIMATLETMRSADKMFEGKQGLITIRDLLKWGARRDESVSFLNLALAGYYLLGERVRDPHQKKDIKELIAKEAGVQLAEDTTIYAQEFGQLFAQFPLFGSVLSGFDIQLNTQFKRILCLTSKAFENREPVLLIGQTGCGKTTLAQMMAQVLQVPFYSLNCHKHTEASDFLGGWKPARGKQALIDEAKKILSALPNWKQGGQPEISDVADLEKLILSLETVLSSDSKLRLEQIIAKLKTEFEWVEGNLVEAVRSGGIYLIDEISLANDSVLERLNSLLEATRELSVQQGDQEFLTLAAHPRFHIIATMNPSGDYGKRELSPALRNRFTEIWATSILDAENFGNETQAAEVREFLEKFVRNSLRKLISDWTGFETHLPGILVYLWDVLLLVNGKYQAELRPLNLRDLATFCQLVGSNWGSLGLHAVLTSSCVVFETLKSTTQSKELERLLEKDFSILHSVHFGINGVTLPAENLTLSFAGDQIGLGGIRVAGAAGAPVHPPASYFLNDSHIKQTLFRVLLGLQSNKPILIEGQPGTGKTSLIEMLGRALGHQVFKVNLSEQTDLIDLLGSYVPDELRAGFFSWKDGLLLRALKQGAWIIFDELNLANQTVLEGLNSILDHRGEVFLPDLNASVAKQAGFRFFGCQNPMGTSGSRKGLPASFLNRFFKIYTRAFPKNTVAGILNHVAKSLTTSSPALSFVFKMFFQEGVSGESGQGLWRIMGLRQMLKTLRFVGAMSSKSSSGTADPRNLMMGKMVADLFVVGQLGKDASPILSSVHSYFEAKKVRIDFGAVQTSPQTQSGPSFALCCYSESNPSVYFSSEFLGKLVLIDSQPLKHLSKLAFTLSAALELEFPVLLESRSHDQTLTVHRLIESMARARQTSLRKLLLYKSADIADLVGNYEQCNWEMAYKRLLKEIRKWGIEVAEGADDQNGSTPAKDEAEALKQRALGVLGACQTALETNSDPQVPSSTLIQKILSLANVIRTERSLFLWTFSPLLKAIIQGDWILVSECEQASPAVLEKLNGLLDDNEFYVNECFDDSGAPLRVKRHPNARIFFLFEATASKEALRERVAVPAGFQSRCFTIKMDEYLEGLEDSERGVCRTQVQLLSRLAPLNVLPPEYVSQGLRHDFLSRHNVVKLAYFSQRLGINLSLMFDQPLPFFSPSPFPRTPITTLPKALEWQTAHFLKFLVGLETPQENSGASNGKPTPTSFDVIALDPFSDQETARLRSQVLADLSELVPGFNWEPRLQSLEAPHLGVMLTKLMARMPHLTPQFVLQILDLSAWEGVFKHLNECAVAAIRARELSLSSVHFQTQARLADETKLLEMISLRLASPRLAVSRVYTTDPLNNPVHSLLTNEALNAKERLVAALNPNLAFNLLRLASSTLNEKSRALTGTSLESKLMHAVCSGEATVFSDGRSVPSEAPAGNSLALLSEIAATYIAAVDTDFEEAFSSLNGGILNVFDHDDGSSFRLMSFDDRNSKIFLAYLMHRPHLLLTKFDQVDDLPSQLFPNVLEVAEVLRKVGQATQWLHWQPTTNLHKDIPTVLALNWKETALEISRRRAQFASLKFTLGESVMLFQLVDHITAACPPTIPPKPQATSRPTLAATEAELKALTTAVASLRANSQKTSTFLTQKESFISAIKLLLHLESIVLKAEQTNFSNNFDDLEVQSTITGASKELVQATSDLCGILDWCFKHQIAIETSAGQRKWANSLWGEVIAGLSADRLQSATQVFSDRLNDSLQHILGNLSSVRPHALQRDVVDFVMEAIATAEHCFNAFLGPQVLQKLDHLVFGLQQAKGPLQVLGCHRTLGPADPAQLQMLIFESKFDAKSRQLLCDHLREEAKGAWRDMLQAVEAMNESYKSQIKSTGLSQAAKLIRLQEQLERAARYEYTKEAVQENRDEREADFRELFNLTPFEGLKKATKDGQSVEQKENLNRVTQRFNRIADKFWSDCLCLLGLEVAAAKGLEATPEEFGDAFLEAHWDQTSLSSDSRLLQKIVRTELVERNAKETPLLTRLDLGTFKPMSPLVQLFESFLGQKKAVLSAFNFYEAATDLQPARRFVSSLNKLTSSLAPYSSNPDFSELFSLKSLLKSVRTVSDMKLNSSLSDLCSGLETLLRGLEEFNFTLPSALRLQSDADSLEAQLVELRRLEKHKWKDFVLIKRHELMNEDVAQVAGKIQLLQADLGAKASLRIFDELVGSATLLNFEQRMVLLLNLLVADARTSAAQKIETDGMEIEGPKSAVSLTSSSLVSLQTDPKRRALVNLLTFYASFYEEISEKTRSLQPQIEEPMKTSMKLMNWHFEDLVNLKMNVEKLYRGIHRSVKAQKELLDVGVAPTVILQHRASVLFSSLGEAHANFDAALFSAQSRPVPVKADPKSPQTKQVLNKTAFMALLNSSPLFSEHFTERDLSLLKLLSASKITRLFSAVPKKALPKFKSNLLFKDELGLLMKDYMQRLHDLVGEKKRSFVARALLDFTAELTSFGLKKRFNFQNPSTTHRLFDTMQVVDVGFLPQNFLNSELGKEVGAKVGKANARLCRMVDLLRTFLDTQTFSQDLSPDERDKLISFCFGLFVKLNEHGLVVHRLLERLRKVQETRNQAEARRRQIEDQVQFIVEGNSAVAKTEAHVPEKELRMLQQISQLVATKRSAEALTEATKFVWETEVGLRVRDLVAQLATLDAESARQNSQPIPESVRSSLDKSRSLLLLKVSGLKKEYTESSETNFNFIDAQLTLLKALGAYTAVSQRTVAGCSGSSLSRIDTEWLVLTIHSIDWLYKLNKFAYLTCLVFSNLVYKGFCLPKDEEGEAPSKEGKMETRAGTGMGEGEGNQNVTEELEFEEQVLGTKGEKGPEGDEEDDFAEPDPLGKDEEEMEMENDFEGTTDRKKEGEEEQAQGQKQQKRDDPQDEMSDVDDRKSDVQLFQDEKEEEEEEELRADQDLELEAQEMGEREQKLEAKKKEKEDARTLDKEGVQAKEEEEVEGEPMEIESAEENAEGQEEFNQELPQEPQETQEEAEEVGLEDIEEPQEANPEQLEGEEAAEEGDAMEEEVVEEEVEEPGLELEAPREEKEEQLQETQPKESRKIDDAGQLGAQQNDSDNRNFSNLNQRDESRAGSGVAKKTDQKSQAMNDFKKNLDKLFRQQARIKESSVKKLLEDVQVEPRNPEELPQQPQPEQPQTFEPDEENEGGEAEFGTKNAGINQNNGEIDAQDEPKERKEGEKSEQAGKPGLPDFSAPLDDTLLGKRDTNPSAQETSESLKRTKNSEAQATEAIREYAETVQTPDAHQAATDAINETVEPGAHIQAEKLKLCEELKSILEQKKVSDLKGDYRTGKRLNMKRVISYIASNYRKDKIWLRRTDPNQQNYRILVGVDDSSSMR